MKTILLLLLLYIPLQARLGDTLEQARERYGKETETDAETGMVLFSKGGFQIAAHFHGNVIGAIIFLHPKKGAEIFHPDITAVELVSLLKANGAGLVWTEREDFDFVTTVYLVPDGSRTAIHNTVNQTLMIATKGFLDRQQAAKKAEEIQNLEGF